MASQQNITLKARGLYSFQNALSEVPDGALSTASNVVIDRDGVISPRRGFKLYGDAFGVGSSRAKQLIDYKNRILRHWGTTLDVDSNGTGTFVTLTDSTGGTASVTEPVSGVRIKYVEVNGNLYFTSSAGTRKISCLDPATIASKPVTAAGGIKALDGQATLNSTTGWFTQDSTVAYRVVWGIKDENTNVVLGSPSQRIVIANPLLTLLISDYNRMVADLAVVAAVAPLTLTGDTTNTSTTINNITTTQLSIGMTVSGTGIPGGTTIATVGTTSITISAAATATNTGVSLTLGQKLHATDYASLKLSLNSSSATLYAALKSLANGVSNKLDNDMGGTTFQSIALTPVTTPVSPTPTGTLLQIQSYYDAIIDALNVTTGIATYAKASIGGGFLNSTQSATSNIIFTIPASVTTAHFYQVYRSTLFTSSGASTIDDISPDDELRLIFESNPTSADISNEYINFYDNIPESLRVSGENLYTNANSGSGIAQANEPPPLSRDIAQFKFNTFYANTQSAYSLQVSLLTASGLANGTMTIARGGISNTYTFVPSTRQVTNITCVAGNLYTSSGTSDYFDIYSANSLAHYRVWFQVGTSVAPATGGGTLVECAVLNTDTASQVTAKLQIALTGLLDFSASAVGAVVTVENEAEGPATSPANHVANGGFSITVTTAGTGEDAANKKVGISNASTPAQQIDLTARSLVRVINKNASEVVYAYYISGATDLPGIFVLQTRVLGDPNFYLACSSTTIGQKFDPAFGTMTAISAISIANPTHVTSTAHGLTTGQSIIISGSNSTPSIDGVQTVTVIDANTFSIPVNVTGTGSAGGFILQSAAKLGTNEIRPNRIFFSKTQQPEAVPLVNYIDVGPKNKNIIRILPLRDSLFILSEAGIWRLAGDDASNFQVTLFDSSTLIKASDSAVVLNNQIYVFSSQGVTAISDTGVSVVSRPIENKLLPLITSTYTNFSSSTFAIGYESDRAYMLFTVSNTADTIATICYRFNTFTNTWTSWDISKACGVVDIAQDVLYLGAGDTNSIEVERKSFTRQDHADRESTLTIPTNGVTGATLALGGLFGVVANDVLVQTQYLTIEQYNRLLLRLDTDYGLAQSDYYATQAASAGMSLRVSLTNLATKLDSDSGLSSHTYSATVAPYTTSFADTQAAFNAIVGLLNADPNTRKKSYATSSGTTAFEVPVSSVSSTTLKITTTFALPFIAGTITHYQQIPASVTWVPHHFGDASMLKHVSESTLLFETIAFTNGTASYSSDLSPGLASIPFQGEGTGIWGGFNFGTAVFGGAGTSRPFRTFVPAAKQRCRYISGAYQHSVAREQFALYGISFTYSPVSNRAYR